MSEWSKGNPFVAGAEFRQELKLHESYVEITGQSDGATRTTVRLWVEVDRPVVHVDVEAAQPVSARATFETWRYQDIQGDKNNDDDQLSERIHVDDQHVIWLRSTEYEIFTVGPRRHTLGALFVLGQCQTLQKGVPPWRPVIEEVRRSEPQALFDMDKLDWPFAMLLPTIAPGTLYELANNHMWRTEFAFRNWNTAAPAFLQPPFGASQGGHREWLDYTHGMYHTLLNCGLRLPPSADVP